MMKLSTRKLGTLGLDEMFDTLLQTHLVVTIAFAYIITTAQFSLPPNVNQGLGDSQHYPTKRFLGHLAGNRVMACLS